MNDLTELNRFIQHIHAKYRNDTSDEVAPHNSRPFNLMINAGAIAVASLINGRSPEEGLADCVETLRRAAGRSLKIENSLLQIRRGSIDKSGTWK